MKICIKCGKEFDLFKFGAPGDPTRDICWKCKPPNYAKSTRKTSVSCDELDAMEDRCVRDWEE